MWLMLEITTDLIYKGPILLIDIEHVIGEIVIWNIDILPAILIDIHNADTQSVTFKYDAGLDRYIRKTACSIEIIAI